jgi:hypothetical protein
MKEKIKKYKAHKTSYLPLEKIIFLENIGEGSFNKGLNIFLERPNVLKELEKLGKK